jgi:hypothetical protein
MALGVRLHSGSYGRAVERLACFYDLLRRVWSPFTAIARPRRAGASSQLGSGIERYRERDDLCSDVRRRVLGLESGVGSEGGLHCRVRADERPENAGCFGSGIDQADGRCFSLIHSFWYYGRIRARNTREVERCRFFCRVPRRTFKGLRQIRSGNPSIKIRQ